MLWCAECAYALSLPSFSPVSEIFCQTDQLYYFTYKYLPYFVFSGAVEAGIAHGLKKRAAGLLPPQDTQSLLLKLTRLSEPAAELVKKLSGEDETNKDGSRNLSPGN